MTTTPTAASDGKGLAARAPLRGRQGELVGVTDAVGTDPSGSVVGSDHPGGTVPLVPAALWVVPALAVVGVGLARAAADGASTADAIRLELTLGWMAAAFCLLVRPGLRRIGRLVSVGALLGAACFAAGEIGHSGSTEAGHDGRLAATVLPGLLMAVVLHFLVSSPDGGLVNRRRRVAVALGYAAGLGFGLWAWFESGGMTVAEAALGWSLAVVIGIAFATRRYRSVPGIDRQRLQLFAAGAVVAFELGLAVGGLALLIKWPAHPWAITAGGTVLVPLGVVAATFPRPLNKSDRVLVRLLTVTGLSVVVLAVYLLIILGFGHDPSSADHQVLGLSILAAALVALGASVFHHRVQQFALRLVYGSNAVPDDVVKTFSSRLTRAVTMDELLLQFVESLHKSMVLTSAEVFTGSDEILERSASIPDRGPGALRIGPLEQPVVARAGVSGNAWTAVWLPAVIAGRDHAQLRVCPITYGGDLLGLAVVERPVTEPAFTEKEDLVLVELSRQVGLALYNVRLDSALQSTLDEVRRQAAELRASRARIVASADAERRRVERDLHDGVQQHLVALAVNVRLVRDLVAEDPEGATQALDEIAGEVKATVQELRDLAHGIYPPLLMDSGLAEALRSVAARSPLDVETSVGNIGRFTPEIEAAVYFCCLEALQNAAKHAPEAHVVLRAWEEEGGLLFTVADDGPGFDPKIARSGHGFMNMSDRLGAIGGSVRWDSQPGAGSVVRGSIPIA